MRNKYGVGSLEHNKACLLAESVSPVKEVAEAYRSFLNTPNLHNATSNDVEVKNADQRSFVHLVFGFYLLDV
ncbi:hypothetical protein PHJA_000692500 [Phtheirospermum japonicum]|uniref:Uncharacterized protein n=1 Tax=Phtheirospermum japonicum TaxID=374723 RepID=A0A830BK81_9LAMI|nr:hypothetical protein PHJA_000692500 [Phtheirospermum japonicum]